MVGESACKAVMVRKHYNRALRLHKLVFEAMWHLRWKVFEYSLDFGLMIDAEAFQDLEDALNVVRDAEAYDNAASITKSRVSELLKSKLKHADQQESTKESMCSFWLSYLEMVGLLLQFIRAAHWELAVTSGLNQEDPTLVLCL